MTYLPSFTVSILLACSAPVNAAETTAASPCVARNLDFGQPSEGWVHQPLSKLKRDTVYSLAQADGRAVLRGAADHSASLYLYVAFVKPAAGIPVSIGWRWKTDALVPNADNRDKDREDAPLRELVAFDGDKTTLPAEEQKRFKRAKTLTGRDAPYATLMYILERPGTGEQRDSIRPHQSGQDAGCCGIRVGGPEALWHSVQRNLAADYRRVFGAAPGRLLGVAVMADTDNTGTQAIGEYADTRLDCAGRES